jgi:NitT/TauT family transport system ATP-binding protein
MIKIDNISFGYTKTPVLNNFSLTIGDNDKICLFGESGCGKTTLLRLILGLEKPQKGSINKTKGKAAVVFQDNILLPFKTVLENITLMGADKDTALFQLKALGIESFANSLPDELSGGMQRRAAIARALSTDFDFLVLDEPFTGLDEDNIKLAAKHILDTVKDKPIILVTHSLYEAELLNTKIIKL